MNEDLAVYISLFNGLLRMANDVREAAIARGEEAQRAFDEATGKNGESLAAIIRSKGGMWPPEPR